MSGIRFAPVIAAWHAGGHFSSLDVITPLAALRTTCSESKTQQFPRLNHSISQGEIIEVNRHAVYLITIKMYLSANLANV